MHQISKNYWLSEKYISIAQPSCYIYKTSVQPGHRPIDSIRSGLKKELMAIQIDAVYENGGIQSDLQANKNKTTSIMLTDSTANGSSAAIDSNDFNIITHCDNCSIPESSNNGNNPDTVSNQGYISQDATSTDGDCDERKESSSSPKPSDNGHNTINCNQKCISCTDDIISLPAKNYTMRSVNGSKQNAVCSRLIVIFSTCLIIGVFSLPIILFLVNHIGDDDTEVDTEFSPGNYSEIIKACNVSVALDPDYVDQISYTFEALRTVNLPSSQLYCTERVEVLFCDALMECSSESCVQDIVCQQVRQEYCTAEWRMLEARNQTDQLIDCTDYEETAKLNCSDQFGNNGTLCLPLCEEFSQFDEDYTNFRTVFIPICLIVNAIGGIIVLVFSFRKRKKMFSFPQILVPINAGNVIYLNVLSSVSTAGNRKILCSDKFLFDALENPTTFCTIQGFTVFSVLVLYTTIWLVYVIHLALSLIFPLELAKFSKSGYSRMLYIAEVLIVYLYGTVPSIVSAAKSRYRMISFPPTFCDGYDDQTYLFYTITLPIVVAVCISLIVMILILYKVHTHLGIFKKRQKGSTGKQACTYQFTVPEIKISFVLFYWLILAGILWTSVSVRDSRADIFANNLIRLAGCMAGGNRKGHDCLEHRQDLEAESFPAAEAINYIFTAFLNLASLPFVIQFESIKQRIKKAREICRAKFKRNNKC